MGYMVEISSIYLMDDFWRLIMSLLVLLDISVTFNAVSNLLHEIRAIIGRPLGCCSICSVFEYLYEATGRDPQE
ncbi:hypothetical protein E2320_003983, partial [Naja naja]